MSETKFHTRTELQEKLWTNLVKVKNKFRLFTDFALAVFFSPNGTIKSCKPVRREFLARNFGVNITKSEAKQ
jgi:hypothetical protein